MYSDAVIRHALDASRAGALDPRGAVGRAGDVACGDTVEIELRVEGGTVTQARHRSLACPHGTAAAALPASWSRAATCWTPRGSGSPNWMRS